MCIYIFYIQHTQSDILLDSLSSDKGVSDEWLVGRYSMRIICHFCRYKVTFYSILLCIYTNMVRYRTDWKFCRINRMKCFYTLMCIASMVAVSSSNIEVLSSIYWLIYDFWYRDDYLHTQLFYFVSLDIYAYTNCIWTKRVQHVWKMNKFKKKNAK